MSIARPGFKRTVATLLLTVAFSLPFSTLGTGPATAQEVLPDPEARPGLPIPADPDSAGPTENEGPSRDGMSLDELYAELQAVSPEQSARVAEQIRRAWSRSGSASMDLLLKRGRDALEEGEWATADEHFTALTDHAPDFSEGYVGRAMARFQMDRIGPAVADLEAALALNPRHFDAIRGMAAIFEQLDQPELAYRAYEEVLLLNPGDTEVQEALARLETRVRGRTL